MPQESTKASCINNQQCDKKYLADYYYNRFISSMNCVQDYRVSQYQKVKPIWILLKQETVSWQWQQLSHMQVCTSPRQTTMPAPTTQLLQAGCPSCRPTNSVKALNKVGES